jgi:hypothetical protein
MAGLPYNKILGSLQFQAKACGFVAVLQIFPKGIRRKTKRFLQMGHSHLICSDAPRVNFRGAQFAIDYAPNFEIIAVGGMTTGAKLRNVLQ